MIVLAVALRLWALESDPNPRLDWSSGLLTDEGFYIHNARNLALFGHERTDEFNNMLLAPALHYVQAATFAVFGVGAIHARMVSVILSLAAMALLLFALRPLFGAKVAWLSAGLLGLDHTNLLFSRMALMDPPAALGAIAGFACFVHGLLVWPKSASRGALAFAACGLLIGLTVLNRTICIFLLPTPFIALWAGRLPLRAPLAVATGLAVGVIAWGILWWAPNRTEIGRVSLYYRLHQVQPPTAAILWRNLRSGASGRRGMGPYLVLHTPIVFALSLTAMGAALLRRRNPARPTDAASPAQTCPATAYLAAWLLVGWAALSVSNYSPSRYYVSVYPALMSLAALALGQLPTVIARLGAAEPTARAVRAVIAWFVAYHVIQVGATWAGIPDASPTRSILLTASYIAAAIIAWWRLPIGEPSSRHVAHLARAFMVAIPALWLAVNAYWLYDWVRTMRYTQHSFSRELARTLPRDSVLIGDVAPGLCMDNGFAAITVIPGLCNDDRPVERYAGRPRYIAILDGRWKERYWIETYPALIHDSRRIALRRILRWDVGVYRVDDAAAGGITQAPTPGHRRPLMGAEFASRTAL